MPKKFKGENTKAVVARSRKAEKTAQEKAQKEKEVEDASWADNDKHVLKKQQRKEEKEKKRIEEMQRKNEIKALYEQELTDVTPTKPSIPTKVTVYQLQNEKEKAALKVEQDAVKETTTINDEPLMENVNRLQDEVVCATGIDAAIKSLSVSSTNGDDKLKFKQFKKERLPQLQSAHPDLKMSKLNEMVFKEWQRRKNAVISNLNA